MFNALLCDHERDINLSLQLACEFGADSVPLGDIVFRLPLRIKLDFSALVIWLQVWNSYFSIGKSVPAFASRTSRPFGFQQFASTPFFGVRSATWRTAQTQQLGFLPFCVERWAASKTKPDRPEHRTACSTQLLTRLSAANQGLKKSRLRFQA